MYLYIYYTAINNGGEFECSCKEVYLPDLVSINWKKKIQETLRSSFWDLLVDIENNKISVNFFLTRVMSSPFLLLECFILLVILHLQCFIRYMGKIF